ncbi:hypothetical protein WR25_17716 [Diploscapter pachys]|uniref:Uncharacterized protein n=1 Tax=Diploscapter pachys TaxID=2018661 RepID=A0A2A2JP06_9BILA|nr:hypothetical protein WR25_17716 [Diploscapter pachys]
MNHPSYGDESFAQDIPHPDVLAASIPTDMAGVPAWAVWLFVACGLLIMAVLLLDYCVIRRNALGNTCCARARFKRTPTQSGAAHQKRSTNMLLNV